MEEQLISFDTAKLAKEKGFNLYQESQYSGNKTLYKYTKRQCELFRDVYYAPTKSLLQKVLRDIHNLDVEPKLANQSFKKSYYFGIYTYNGEFRNQIVETNIRYNTYEDALDAGLLEALNHI